MDGIKKTRYIQIQQQLNNRSKFFCPAKWNELFLYLNHGNTNSCHHPIPQKIPAELLTDPFVLHNTPHKLEQQQSMIDGKRPAECHMCWHIEDADSTVFSDRVAKSLTWESDIDTLQVDPHYVPKFIEVVFDNLCNLNCSYCDSGQSSSWAAHITKNALLLDTDYRKLYSTVHVAPGSTQDIYLKAWLSWWDTIKTQVKVLKISGGEPLISPNFWRFFDVLGEAPQLKFAINSNLSVKTNYLDRLADVSKNFQSVRISVSIDGQGDKAEYTRKGLDYQLLYNNMHHWCKTTPENCHMILQSTVNIFSIWSFTDFIDLCAEFKTRYPNKIQSFYTTVVRFPEFQSISLLPKTIRLQLAEDIEIKWKSHQSIFDESEQLLINKILSYLRNDPAPLVEIQIKDLEKDLIKFVDYYDRIGSHCLDNTFPSVFVDWIDNLR
jgi:organic radical activating enzyme